MTGGALAVRETAIPGLLLIDLPVHADNRGWFKENWQREKIVALGLPDFGPVQHNVSFNDARGATRGIHAEPWDKLVSLATGRVFGAWVDLREGPGFGAVVTAELGPATAVFVPRGVGNSYQTLVAGTAYSYLVNAHWSAEAQGEYTFLSLADETAAIDWPIPLDEAELSAKDRGHPRLADVSPMRRRRTLVLGANGQLGRALRRALPDADCTGTPGVAARVRRALSWSFANTLLGRFGTLAISVLIARMLGPEAFGTYAVALVALAAVLSFNELGVSLAIVRWRDDPARIAPTVATISLAASLLFAGLAYAFAPAFAAAMGDPGATGVVRLMLVCVPINGAVATSAALLQREFLQGRRTIADQVNIWLGAVISITLVWLGLGAMSLAIGRVVASLVFAGLLVAFCPAGARFGWDRAVVAPLMRFGLPLAGASAVVFAVGYADQLAVGAVLGTQALGYYVLAANLASWPVSVLSQPVRSVAPAAFARLQDDQRALDAAFRAAFRLLMAVSLPACAFLAGAAAPVIAVVYGEEWAPAALALQWLGLQAAVRIAFELSYDLLAVKRRSATLMTIQAVWLVLLVPAVVVGAHVAGVGGVAVAQFSVAVLVLVACYGAALGRAGIRVAALARDVLLPLGGGVVAGVAGYVVGGAMRAPLAGALLAGTIACAVIAALLLRSRPAASLLQRVRYEGSSS